MTNLSIKEQLAKAAEDLGIQSPEEHFESLQEGWADDQMQRVISTSRAKLSESKAVSGIRELEKKVDMTLEQFEALGKKDWFVQQVRELGTYEKMKPVLLAADQSLREVEEKAAAIRSRLGVTHVNGVKIDKIARDNPLYVELRKYETAVSGAINAAVSVVHMDADAARAECEAVDAEAARTVNNHAWQQSKRK